MLKNTALILLLLFFRYAEAQITLTHNIGNKPVKTNISSCEYEEYWARTFKLSDFGISSADQFIIRSSQVAVSNAYNGAILQFNFYSIDSNFPYSTPKLISYGNVVTTPLIGDTPEIVQIDFDTPIVVPAGVVGILVEVSQNSDTYNSEYAKVSIAGTKQDNDTSWFKGCRELYTYTSTANLDIPVPDANFYINVTGETKATSNYGASATLTHNICDDVIETRIYSCKSSYIYWARTFDLEDFGISTNEEFIINSGQVGINKVGWLPEISFNIYKIDDNFPASFSETDLIGSSQYQQLPHVIGTKSRIIQVDFDTPVVIPAGVEKILVEVYKGIVYGDGLAFIAGSTQDNDLSWQRGCVPGGAKGYFSTADLGYPDANFYINVTGKINHVTNNFDMNISNICSEFLKEFSVENKSNIASIAWDFGDPLSGANNTSTDLSPFHDFSADGNYTITAKVTAIDGSVEWLTEDIYVKEPPYAYGISDVYACEDNFNSGISSYFNLSEVKQQVLKGQVNKVVTFIDGTGKEYKTIPNLFTNTIKDRETITVRVAHKENLCCYSETTFDLIINKLPDLTAVSDLSVCDDDNDGFSIFNLEQMETLIIGANANLKVEFYHEDGIQILTSLNAVNNKIANEEMIKVKVINTDTDCFNEEYFKLKVNTLPIANSLPEIIGCDEDNDGISEYFDTSNVATLVSGNQTGVEISYYDYNGKQLPNPLPNPYTNLIPYQEDITVRVTNLITGCFAETLLVLKTSIKPKVTQPNSLYACDEGEGYGLFDTSALENELIGNQTSLTISYYDSKGVALPSPLPMLFKNTEPWNQTISVKVENSFSNLCVSETTVDLVVQALPSIQMEKTYYLCNLEPSLRLSVASNLDNYEWKYENGDVIATTSNAELIKAGDYSLKVGKLNNGVYCESEYNFELIRSVLPKIDDVKYQELSSNNYIEILASGDGDFEYSIDGIHYQKSNLFERISGGKYIVYVRDILGCGEDFKEVTLIDYPKFFTPNLDGYNDYWHIKGIKKYPRSSTSIFDRYGKLLANLDANSMGWNGLYNNVLLPPSDYWFKTDLGDGRIFTGHFTLKR
ncbi:T9SS type B sorting domain-containing protein [Joostella sp.]|uniref:T9SS type B sorting domain-containing protein n=1 Tax=Joostella sp. TaxID=2231138 RepID=UPI003A901585